GLTARPLFVRPDHAFQRTVRSHPGIRGGLEHLEGGQDPVYAVKIAASGLGIEMRPGHHRAGRWITARPAYEDVADGIDTGTEAACGGPGEHAQARLHVLRCQGLSVDTTPASGADAGQVHMPLPEPVLTHRLDHGGD